MKISGPPHDLQTEANYNFQRSLVEFGAVGREQDFRIAFGQFQSGDEQFFEVVLNLEWSAAARARKGGRIHDDQIEAAFSLGEEPEAIEDIARVEFVSI